MSNLCNRPARKAKAKNTAFKTTIRQRSAQRIKEQNRATNKRQIPKNKAPRKTKKIPHRKNREITA
jgi:hypothetical protein